jgi:RNA polymerase sigma-70 factor (ECF subfamily)
LVDTQDRSLEALAVKVALEKDRQAFSVLFAHFAPRLKSWLKGKGLGDRQAEDIAQDVMVTLWQKADRFDPAKARLSTWLFRVARNRFIDLTRKQKYPEVNADDHMADMVAEEESDHQAILGQKQKGVAQALVALSEDQRAVVELSFFEELSHSQIAERLDLPLGTVKSRLRLAFDVLRRELGVFK